MLHLFRDEADDDCLMGGITVDRDAAAAAATTPFATSSTSDNKALPTISDQAAKASQSGAGIPGVIADLPDPTSRDTLLNSGIATSTNPKGEAGFPMKGSHLSAPVATEPVPAGAATYKPSFTEFSGKFFSTWVDSQKTAKLASKWLKIAPGTYNLRLDDAIGFGFPPGGWTFDMRGVTLLVATPNPDLTSGQAIYINRSEDMTILGGTIWFDQGEQWSHAKVVAITPADRHSTATSEVEKGYDTSVWRGADARNQGCVDSSDPNHYKRPNCNFWYANNYDFSNLDSKRRFTSHIQNRAEVKEGYIVTMMIPGANFRATIASEWNGNLYVNGMTSNGGPAQYGVEEKKTATMENVWNVNPPARPGFAPRVQGPTLSQGHIGLFDFVAGGNAPFVYNNCKWQTSGSPKDLQDMSDQDLHNGY